MSSQQATVSTLSKQLGMNFNKMDPAEVQFFTTLVEKYSTTYRSMLPKKGHAKYSDFQSRSSSAHADVPGDWGLFPTSSTVFVWTQTLLAKFVSRARDALLARKNKLSLLSLVATRIVYQL